MFEFVAGFMCGFMFFKSLEISSKLKEYKKTLSKHSERRAKKEVM